jgi:hypothetical protein
LLATSTLRLLSSVNATTACSGCSVRCPSAFVLSFSAEDSGRYSPRCHWRNWMAIPFG